MKLIMAAVSLGLLLQFVILCTATTTKMLSIASTVEIISVMPSRDSSSHQTQRAAGVLITTVMAVAYKLHYETDKVTFNLHEDTVKVGSNSGRRKESTRPDKGVNFVPTRGSGGVRDTPPLRRNNSEFLNHLQTGQGRATGRCSGTTGAAANSGYLFNFHPHHTEQWYYFRPKSAAM